MVRFEKAMAIVVVLCATVCSTARPVQADTILK